MKRINWVCVVAVTAAVLFAAAGASLAAERGDGPGKPPSDKEWKQEQESLGLSPEQRAQMKALREEFRGKQSGVRDQIKAKREAIRQELDGTNPDRARAEAIIKEISVLEQQMEMNRVDEILKIRSILTPEQFQKLHQLHEKKAEKRAHSMNKNGHRGMWKDGGHEK
jgi:Spy/CpxP family protein refolding chaperone